MIKVFWGNLHDFVVHVGDYETIEEANRAKWNFINSCPEYFHIQNTGYQRTSYHEDKKLRIVDYGSWSHFFYTFRDGVLV